jgi:RES domain-containing protein
VAAIVEDVIRNNYGHGHYNNNTDYFDGDDLTTIVEDVTGSVDYELAEAVARRLIEGDPTHWDFDEPFFSDEATFVRLTDENLLFNEHNLQWEQFCRGIMHGRRFFNADAKGLLEAIFTGIHLQKSTTRSAPVYAIRPSDKLARVFRARVTSDAAERQKMLDAPALNLGPPPDRKRQPGRMNPSGIQAFYGAFDIDTCVAELRPAVGTIVASAEFEITEELWVLDMTQFTAPLKEPNLFAKDHHRRVTQWRFMQSFEKEISRPISRHDEHLDYIPTQVVAEFLSNHLAFEAGGKTRRIEGIVFRSAQRPAGKNIVILGGAANVEHNPKRSGGSDELSAGRRGPIVVPKPWAGRDRMRVVENSVAFHRIEGAVFDKQPHKDFTASDVDPEEF